MRLARALFCAAAMVAFLAPGARADEYTKTTHLTFSGPVQLPGITLPAGTYTFKLADPDTGRTAIQVWDKDGGELLTTLLTINDERLEAPNEPLVLFSEQPAGSPQAIKSWFYPGERIGMEFIYPKDQAMQIARATHESVLAYNDEANPGRDLEAARKSEVGRVNGDGQRVDSDNQAADANAAAAPDTTAAQASAAADRDAAAPAPAPEPSQTADATAAQRPQPTADRSEATAPAAVGTTGTAQAQDPASRAQQDRPNELPRTASSMGLIGLLSGLSLAGAAGVHAARRRFAPSRMR